VTNNGLYWVDEPLHLDLRFFLQLLFSFPSIVSSCTWSSSSIDYKFIGSDFLMHLEPCETSIKMASFICSYTWNNS
jgi:hypothetical protein